MFRVITSLILLCCFCGIVKAEPQSENSQVNLMRLFGLQPESIRAVSMQEVRDVLERPPNIKDAIFSQLHGAHMRPKALQVSYSLTNCYRCAWSTNGYILANASSEAELFQLSAQNDTMGRFGNTNWHASGNAIVFEDISTDSQKILGEGRFSLAQEPLKLGILPLIVGKAKFLDETNFEAQDILGKKMHGSLIQAGHGLCSGVEYETDGAPGFKYLVTFLMQSNQPEKTSDSISSLAGWMTCSIGLQRTNLVVLMQVSRLELTSELLPETYFEPTRWLSKTSAIPVLSAYAISNQLMIPVGGKLVSTKALNRYEIMEDRPNRRPHVLAMLVAFTLLPLIWGVIQWIKKFKANKPNNKKT